MSVPTIYTIGKVTEVRRAIKQAAKAGGHFHVDVPMHAPTAPEARDLVMMARGERFHPKTVYGSYYGRRVDAGWQPYFKADPAYEARMAAWAERFMTPEVAVTLAA